MKHTVTFPSGTVVTRTSDKAYTHAVRCPQFPHDGGYYSEVVTFTTGGLKAAEKLASSLGYAREFKHWSGGRRVYNRTKRLATPEIAQVVSA